MPTVRTPRSMPLWRTLATEHLSHLLIVLLVGAAVPVVQPFASPVDAHSAGVCADGSATYVVEQGDSWFQIAADVGIGTSTLLRSNRATLTTVLHPGGALCLPEGSASVKSEAAAGAAASGRCPSASSGSYTVVAGDSWFGIARSTGAPLRDLYGANDAAASTPLTAGEVLCLPESASGPSVIASRARSSGAGIEALPLQGPCWYGDTWGDARAAGRRHEGVDILAEEGQYVYAVVDGTLTGRAWDQPGLLAGNAWWLTASDGSGTYYFYAHLYAFAPGLKVGSKVDAGEIIGFVGTTGRSAAPHVHFEVHPNGGGAVNPYGLVDAMGGCNTGTPYAQPGGWTPDSPGISVEE